MDKRAEFQNTGLNCSVLDMSYKPNIPTQNINRASKKKGFTSVSQMFPTTRK